MEPLVINDSLLKLHPGDNPYTDISAIPLPEGYTRVAYPRGSYAAWLRGLPLRRDKTVYLYNGEKKANQTAQFAVVDMTTGQKDLQQCADVAMRLRAEYLFSSGQYAAISFTDYAGKKYAWKGDSDRAAFDRYLETVFGWCGSASLEKQLAAVPLQQMKTGDVFIRGGFPGHAVTVVDMAVNTKGEKIYLLVQGYQPAQDMHVLVNPVNATLSPWYALNNDAEIITPEWRFSNTELHNW